MVAPMINAMYARVNQQVPHPDFMQHPHAVPTPAAAASPATVGGKFHLHQLRYPH
jgi:hypothetical protein